MGTVPANIIPPGVTVFCDQTLGAAIRALDGLSRAQTGAPVSVLSAPALSMLAQLQRHTRNDVLFTLSTAIDQAIQLQLVKPVSRIDGFTNNLVLANLTSRHVVPTDKAGLVRMLAGMTIALTDNTVASGLNGRAVLEANGLTKAVGNRVIGTANTGDVAFLVVGGVVDVGLMYATDVRADPRLTILANLTADPALTRFAGAVNEKAVSPNAQAFLAVMRSAPGRAILAKAGIEIAA